MSSSHHLTFDGCYKEILSYKASLKKGLNASIFKINEFKDIKPFDVSNIIINNNNNLVLDPYYITGFTDADGSFFISKPSSRGKWPNYDATFSIAQHNRDKDLLNKQNNLNFRLW